jgi:kynurenine formamidase
MRSTSCSERVQTVIVMLRRRWSTRTSAAGRSVEVVAGRAASVEVMTLETLSEVLAARGTAEFLFVGAPLNVVGATGAPIRPLAVIGP